ncbi:MAG: protein kinase [Clostridia bacterium]|nr:protein kinase [Clostridia bacterium]
MALREIESAEYEKTIELRDGLIVKSKKDGQRYVLKPVLSFIDERVAEWLSESRHPGIPRCIGKTSQPDAFFVFEYLEGKALSQIIGAEEVTEVYLLKMMQQWADILSFLHLQGTYPLLHLDIKPSNLIITQAEKAGLIDFAAARMMDDEKPLPFLPEKQAMTLHYAAPELTKGNPCMGSDLYALGLAVLVTMTGLSPAECLSRPLPELLPEGPADLQTLFSRCLHTDCRLRYSQAEELAYDIKQLLLHYNPESKIPAGQKPEKRLEAPILCIWDGAAFGCELAGVLGTSQEVLVIDADLQNPRADMLLGQPHRMNRETAAVRKRGLEFVFQAEREGRLSPHFMQSLARNTAVSQVKLLDGMDKLEDYEYCHLDSLNQTLKWARLIADVVLVLCNRSIFDAFTCLTIMASDLVLIPLEGNVCDFREINRAFVYLAERYHLQKDKVCYIAFPYNNKTDLSVGTLNELCAGRFMGCISESAERRLRIGQAIPYAASLSDKNRLEYKKLLKRLDSLSDQERGA